MPASHLRTGLCAAVIGAACLLGNTAPASAIAFTQITDNSGTDFSSDFSVSISDAGSGQVRFLFSTAGGSSGLIGQVYFDDGAGNIASIVIDPANNVGTVDFSAGASPGNLPSGENLTPDFDADFAFGADAPAPTNGVNAGETLALLATLNGGFTFSDLESSLELADLRLGIHAQSLGDGEDSEALVNVPPETPGGPPIVTVPAPAGIGLFGVGLLAFAGWRARRRG